jgi:hypothetical protein
LQARWHDLTEKNAELFAKNLFQSKLAFNHDLFAIAALQVVVTFAGERRRGTGTV